MINTDKGYTHTSASVPFVNTKIQIPFEEFTSETLTLAIVFQ